MTCALKYDKGVPCIIVVIIIVLKVSGFRPHSIFGFFPAAALISQNRQFLKILSQHCTAACVTAAAQSQKMSP